MAELRRRASRRDDGSPGRSTAASRSCERVRRDFLGTRHLAGYARLIQDLTS